MSKIVADSIVGRNGAPSFPNGVNVTGVLTATTIGSSSDTITIPGNLTVNGTQTVINTSVLDVKDKTIGIGSTSSPTDAGADGGGIVIYGTTNKTLTYNNTKKAFEFSVPLSNNENRFITGSEKTTRVDGNTVNLVYGTNSSNVAICTNPSGNLSLNVTGIPTSSDFDNTSVTFTVISNASAGTAYSCLTVTLNGLTPTIRWAGGSSQAATAGVTTSAGYTIYSFSGINTVGSASTTANYVLLGTVSGGYF